MRWFFLAALAPIALAATPTVNPALGIGQIGTGLNSWVTADRQGNIILTGQSSDCSLPVVHPLSTCGWLWIAKLDPTGQTILFATYFGDPKVEAGLIWVQADPDGNIVVATEVSTTSLPAVNAFQPQWNGSYDAFVFKLAADGSRVIYATYLGGSGFDNPETLAVDSQGAAYILLQSSSSPDFPTTPQSLKSSATQSWIVAKLSPDGQKLEYSAAFPMFSLNVPTVSVDTAGAAWTIVDGQVVRVASDGGSVQRQPVPSWAANWSTKALPDNQGGYWLTGFEQNQTIPTTPDAFEPSPSPIPYVRIEKAQIPPLAKPITAQEITGFAVDPFEPWRIYAATTAGLFVTEDNGWTWNPTSLMSICDWVAVSPLDQNMIYVTGGGNFYRSTDRGATWAVFSSGVKGSFGVDAQAPGLIYSALGRSADGGLTWQAFAVPQPVNGPCGSGCLFTSVTGVIADPVQSHRVYVFTQTRCTGFCPIVPGLLRSDDGGKTFVGIPYAGSIAVDPATQDLYLANGAVTVFRNGDLAHPEVLSVPEAQAIAVGAGTIYLSLTNSTVVQSVDGGRTWSPVATVPAPSPLMIVSIGGVLHLSQPLTLTDAFAFHYQNGQIVYGTAFGGWNTTATTAAVGPNGHLYLGGFTGGGMPLSNSWQPNFGGFSDGFLAEFDSNGLLLNSTYIGGALEEDVTSVIPLDDGSVIVLGYSDSKDFFSQLMPSAMGGGSTFVLRFRPSP